MTTAVSSPHASPTPSRSLWGQGWQRLKRNRVGWLSLWVVVAYLLLAIAGSIWWANAGPTK
ncbi:hypothetical protein [Paludibacterium denitrificans]|uniref:hypothetical protein n=1 Tax=Paludibacterium denitrificans TaxID=2675226 RepID=UPI001E334BDE|nr:hypothetical protein [Paludibacterium denitrificans]